MFRGSLNRRDIIIISSMLGFSLIFLLLSLIVPRYVIQPTKAATDLRITPNSTAFTPSHKVKREISPSTSDGRKSDDEISDLVEELIDNLTDEGEGSTSTKISTEDISEVVSSVHDTAKDERAKNKVEKEKETYPVGDLRRLTPLERAHYQRIVEELRALAKEWKTRINIPLPLEERIAREEEYSKRHRRAVGQHIYYLKKLGYKPPPPLEEWPESLIIDPHTEGDLAGMRDE
ncbi:TPA: hypothetical protein ENG04_12505 [Candidatus Poribacteria bacterium]|nr:hypothetical protein [Candidatus Poribacteria bacterium]HEX30892.1 hypothetical protein [Candidatus Poribacteria bacterium]